MLKDAVGFFEKFKRNIQDLRVGRGSVRLKLQPFFIGVVCELS